MITLGIALVASGVVILMALLLGRPLQEAQTRSATAEAERTGTDTPRLQHMEKVSDTLTKGVALLTAVVAILAARNGGVGRLVANGGLDFRVAVGCTVASVLFALGSWIVVSAATTKAVVRLWLTFTLLSVVLFAASMVGLFRASEASDEMRDRPTLTAEQGEASLEITASIDLLKADAFMRTTVYGYPPSRSRRDLLFNSTTGPDAEGHAAVTGTVRADLSPYEVVEVRAFRGDDDPGCEQPIAPEEVTNETGPAACASIWIEPREERRNAND